MAADIRNLKKHHIYFHINFPGKYMDVTSQRYINSSDLEKKKNAITEFS